MHTFHSTRKIFYAHRKLIPPRLFPTTICLRVSRIIFDAESLLNKFTRAQIFNATVEFLLFAVHRFSEISRALHTHTHCAQQIYALSLNFLQCKNCYSLEHTTRSFPSRNIAFGSCICFEEQSLLYCDSLRPIRYVMDPFFTLSGVLNYNDTITLTELLYSSHTLQTRVFDEGI